MTDGRKNARKPSLLQTLLRAPSRRYQNDAERNNDTNFNNSPAPRSAYYSQSIKSSGSSVSIYSQPSPPAAAERASGWDWAQRSDREQAPDSIQTTEPGAQRTVRPKPSMTYSSKSSYYTARESAYAESTLTRSPESRSSALGKMLSRSKSSGSVGKASRRYSAASEVAPPLPLLNVAPSTTSDAPSLSSSQSNESTDSGPLTPTSSQAEELPAPVGPQKEEKLLPRREMDELECVAEEDSAEEGERLYSFDQVCSAASLVTTTRTFPSAPLRSSTFKQPPLVPPTPLASVTGALVGDAVIAGAAQATAADARAPTIQAATASIAPSIPKLKLTRTDSDQAKTGERGSIELYAPPLSAVDESDTPPPSPTTLAPRPTRSISRKKSKRRSASPSTSFASSHQPPASYQVVASSSLSLRLLIAADTALPPSSAGSLSRAGSSASRRSRGRSQLPFEIPPAPLPPCPTLVTPSVVETPPWLKNIRALGEPLKAYEPPQERKLPPARPPRPAKSIRRAKQPLHTRDELLNGVDQAKSAEERVRSIGFVMPAEVRQLEAKGELPKVEKAVVEVEDDRLFDDPVAAWAMMEARGIAGFGMRATLA